MKKSKVIFVLLLIAGSSVMAQVRVKKHTLLRHFRKNTTDSLVQELIYDQQNRVVTIKKHKTEYGDNSVEVKYDSKNKPVTATDNTGKALYTFKFDKEGNLTAYDAFVSTDKLSDIRYKDKKITAFKLNGSGGTSSTYELTYDGDGKLVSAKSNKSTHPYVFTYENGLLMRIQYGGLSGSVYDKEIERYELTWENKQLKKVELFRQSAFDWSREIEYDAQGNITAERVKSAEKSTTPHMETYIEYEPGEGNDDIFFSLYDWKNTIFLREPAYTIKLGW